MDIKVRQSAGIIFIILVIGMITYLVLSSKASEGFVDSGRCGVNLPSCSGEHIRCMNGYCKSDIPSKIPVISDLKIIP